MWPRGVVKIGPLLVVGGPIAGWTADQLLGQILIVMLGTFC